MLFNIRKLNLIFKIFCVLTVFLTSFVFLKPIQAIDDCPATRPDGTPGGLSNDGTCPAYFPDYSCVSPSEAAIRTGCKTGCCGGDRICCPGGGEGGEEEGEAGGEVGAGLKEAAGVAGIEKFDIATKIGDIISAALGFVGIIFLILMIVGGLMWMTAGGSEDRIGKAKKLIVSAVVGMIIVFSAYAVTYFVTTTLLGG